MSLNTQLNRPISYTSFPFDIIQAAVSTFQYLSSQVASCFQESNALHGDVVAIRDLLIKLWSGSFTRDCILMSALALCFFSRAQYGNDIKALISSLIHLFFMEICCCENCMKRCMFATDNYTANAESEGEDLDRISKLSTVLPLKQSPLMHVAAVRALLGCLDIMQLTTSLLLCVPNDRTEELHLQNSTVESNEENKASSSHTSLDSTSITRTVISGSLLLDVLLPQALALVEQTKEPGLHFLSLQALSTWTQCAVKSTSHRGRSYFWDRAK